MAENSGFFASVGGDRKYNMDFLARWVASFIGNGVYDGELAVTADGSAMTVTLPAGRAWINGYYYRNDGDMTLAIDNADGVLNRKDIVVLRWDVNARSITAQVIKGAPASDAIAPGITRTVEQYDLKIAEISIPAGTTAISQSLITDTRLDNDVCGIVTGVVDQADTTTLYAQIQDDLARFRSVNEADFTAWVAGLKDVLDDETAGNLLNLITEHKADTAVHLQAGERDKINGAVQGSVANTDFLGKTNYVYPGQNPIDLNSVVTETHEFAINATNFPTGFSNHGFLDVSKFDGSGFAPATGGVIKQVYTDYGNAARAVRTKVNDTWGDWQIEATLTLSTAAPTATLAAGKLWGVYDA